MFDDMQASRHYICVDVAILAVVMNVECDDVDWFWIM